MKRDEKSIKLWLITELYIKAHGIQTIDWNLSYFAQPATIISCIGDIAELVGIRRGSKGWSKSQTLYERIKNIQPF